MTEIQKTKSMPVDKHVFGMHACVHVCMDGWMERIWSRPSLIHHYPIKSSQAYSSINVFVCEQNSDRYGTDPLQTPSVYSITNVYLSVNTIQMNMEIDRGWIQSRLPLNYHEPLVS